MKKKYVKPVYKVLKVNVENQLLSGSGGMKISDKTYDHTLYGD